MTARLNQWFDALAHVPELERHSPDADEVCVALGSNLGDRLSNIHQGVRFLGSLQSRGGTLRLSSIYESEPVGCPPGSPAFYNAVVVFRSGIPPVELLNKLKKYESSLGRDLAAPRNSPRPLDMDLIYHGCTELRDEFLTLPHPRATERRFVLLPLAELRPYLLLPGQELTVVQLLGTLCNGEKLQRVSCHSR